MRNNYEGISMVRFTYDQLSAVRIAADNMARDHRLFLARHPDGDQAHPETMRMIRDQLANLESALEVLNEAAITAYAEKIANAA